MINVTVAPSEAALSSRRAQGQLWWRLRNVTALGYRRRDVRLIGCADKNSYHEPGGCLYPYLVLCPGAVQP
jgi:hypothetical protein